MGAHRSKIIAILLGLAVTLATTAAAFNLSMAQRIELQLFDFRVRHFSPLRPVCPIVHVDIDDNSLERVGRWPWSREKTAAIIRAIGELEPKSIVVDLLLDDYQPPPVSLPQYGPQSDVEPDVQIVGGESSGANAVFPDKELALALRSAGNVLLAAQPDNVSAPTQSKPTPVSGDANKRPLRDQVFQELIKDFSLDEDQLAARLSRPRADIEKVIAGAKSMAARWRVGRMFEEAASPTLGQVLTSLLGDRAEVLNADRTDVLRALRHHLGVAAMQKAMLPMPAGATDFLPRASDMSPPHFYLGPSANDIAAVTFQPDMDGTVRRVPPLIRVKDRVIAHMGFAAACRALELDDHRIEIASPFVMNVPTKKGDRIYRVPLDGQGNMLIPWASSATGWREGRDYPHLSAAKLWALVSDVEEMQGNQSKLDDRFAELVAVVRGQAKVSQNGAGATTQIAGDNAFRRSLNQRFELQRKLHQGELDQSLTAKQRADLQSRIATLDAAIEKEEKLAAGMIRRNFADLSEIPAKEIEADASLKADLRRYRDAKNLLDGEISHFQGANAALRKSIEGTKRELKPHIANKHVFLGFAATATGDIVPTPIDPQTNGVMCHAHVLSGFLQDQFLVGADVRTSLALCLLFGAIVSGITGMVSPWRAFAAVLFLLILYALLNCFTLFKYMHTWVNLSAPMGAAFLTWSIVTLYRQLTAEREKRVFSKQLAQYTAPAIAARIAESPEAARAFKTIQTRDVTCFFSDLAGFTTIAEQENAEVVQYVLNTYLERMSQVIWRHRGLLSKFMGDGIMAFFNPSVDPMPGHARAACETALDALTELDKLKSEQHEAHTAAIFSQLAMRVGLASGNAKNGDMGSELKADYTVIGDVVNLSARLEPANKVFGTRIMISGPLRERVKEDYEFRYLAELQVKGKRLTVPVYELIARRGQLTEEQREYIERFEAGVALYKDRKWDECIVHFTRLLARRFDDAGASRYIDACQEMKAFPPDENWRGALELKEK